MSLLSDDRIPFRLPPIRAAADDDSNDVFSLSGSVGPHGDNRREDVIKVQQLLAQTGDFDVTKLGFPTGWPSSDLYRGIRAAQKRHGKDPDGTVLPMPVGGVAPDGTGETMHALHGEVGKDMMGQKALTPQQADAYHEAQARGEAKGGKQSGAPQYGLPHSDEPPVQAPQPKPGQQTAFYDTRSPQTKPMVGPGGGGSAPQVNMNGFVQDLRNLLTGAGAAILGSDTPAADRTAPTDHDQARTPDPAQPEIEAPDDKALSPPAIPKGRVVLTPDGSEVHVPALGKWADDRSESDRQRAEEINEALAVQMVHHDGGRGGAFTQQGIDVVIQACLDEFNKHPHLAGKMSRVAGGHDGTRTVKEEWMPNFDEHGNPVRPGSHLPDFTSNMSVA